MYLNPRRLQDMRDYLDEEWRSWQASPHYDAAKEAEELDMFLTIQGAFASSIDNAYINAWYEQYQQSKQSGLS